MKKNKNLSVILIFFGLFLYSCQTATEALQGKKRSDQSDEFLVEKKNPLAMPPDFDKLPTPGNQELSTEMFSDNNEVKNLLNIDENKNQIVEKNENSADIESSILEKIQ
tara:strand:+ start:263 stop:589 length:327 start_codon:yes stop_codon:yes gene_type:complete